MRITEKSSCNRTFADLSDFSFMSVAIGMSAGPEIFVIAQVSPGSQTAGQIGLHDFIRLLHGSSGDHPDTVLLEESDGSLSHPAGDNHIAAKLFEPSGQNPRFMRRGDFSRDPPDFLFFQVLPGQKT